MHAINRMKAEVMYKFIGKFPHWPSTVFISHGHSGLDFYDATN